MKDPVSTSFALLFLVRATQKAVVQSTDATIERTIGKLGARATDPEIADVTAALEKTPKARTGKLVPYLGDPRRPIRVAAFRALSKIFGVTNGYDPDRDAPTNATAIEIFRTLAENAAKDAQPADQ